MKVILFTVTCVGGAYLREVCSRTLEIEETATLSRLHCAIQEAFDFGDDHPYAFYAGRHERQRKIEFARHIDWDETEATYSSIQLREVFPLPPRLRLYYLFDFGDNWCFHIKRERKKAVYDPEGTYPRVVSEDGPAPEQYPCIE